MRLFVTGAGGLLGSKVVELALRGHEVHAAFLNSPAELGTPVRVDITDRATVHKAIRVIKPDAVIHCAAFINVDECELKKEWAMKVNRDGARFIAEACKSVKARLIHISTDYVFDGERGNYNEDDEPHPVNYYGYSKLMAEQAIQEVLDEYLIVRTSVLYGARQASGKPNFALWLLESLKSGKEVKVLVDQFSTPALNTNVATMALDGLEKGLTGILHAAGLTRVSRYDFGMNLAQTFGLDSRLIKRSTMAEMTWIAKRPRDSSLDVSRANQELSIKPMSLDEALSTLKSEVTELSRQR